MSFGGGGSGALQNHDHSGLPLMGGPLDFVNTTIASLTANSMTYSDGAALQELTIGSDAQVLAVQGGSPSWITNTSAPLVKVTKTFSDIAASEMDIYTLPQDSALINVWADITIVFDLSTGVTIGDAGDDNGFVEASDWTASTGLTDATRGAYITSFKTMRSVSGTTAIKAYNFTNLYDNFSQTTATENYTMSSGGRIEIAQQMNAGQVLVGEPIHSVSFYLKNYLAGQSGTIRAFIRQADGTEIQESSTTLDASTLTGSTLPYTFTFPGTTLSEDDMICINAESMTGGQIMQATDSGGDLTNGTLYQKATPSASYTQISNNAMTFTAIYGTATTDTQGEVDFYLQVVD